MLVLLMELSIDNAHEVQECVRHSEQGKGVGIQEWFTIRCRSKGEKTGTRKVRNGDSRDVRIQSGRSHK